jgi:hypothetical protein
MVHPAAAGPASTNKDINITRLDKKNNQNEIMFILHWSLSMEP